MRALSQRTLTLAARVDLACEITNVTKRRKRPSVDELLLAADDFQLCNGVFSRFASADNQLDVAKYDEPERVVTLVWHSLGIVENGGFRYLLGGEFEGDPGFVYTAASYKRIGAEAAYRCFQEALACFPGCRPQEDQQARLAHYDAGPQATRDRIDRTFWQRVPETRAKLATYIRTNREALATLLLGYEQRA